MPFVLSKKLVKFGVAGVINTGVDWALYFAVTGVLISGGEVVAKLTGAIGGVTSAFILNALWVFGDKFRVQCYSYETPLQRARYIGVKYFQTLSVYAAGMMVNILVFAAARYFMAPELAALILATACSFTINFSLLNRYVFIDV